MGFGRGVSVIGLDQLDFVAGALLLGSLAFMPPLDLLLIVLVITPFVHFLANNLAYWLKLKTVPW
jgi:CDP-2,3-bis-(O-geranylgeranyl)-sn-glycerol synthase